MAFSAPTMLRSLRLQREDRVTEVTASRVFQVADGRLTHAVIVAPDLRDAWCSCGHASCSHVAAALLTIRQETLE